MMWLAMKSLIWLVPANAVHLLMVPVDTLWTWYPHQMSVTALLLWGQLITA